MSTKPSKEVISALVGIQRKMFRAGVTSTNLQRNFEQGNFSVPNTTFMANLKHLQASLLIFEELDVLMAALGIDKLFADGVNENNESLRERISLASPKQPERKTGPFDNNIRPWHYPAPL